MWTAVTQNEGNGVDMDGRCGQYPQLLQLLAVVAWIVDGTRHITAYSKGMRKKKAHAFPYEPLPKGFSTTLYWKKLPLPRALVVDKLDIMWVAATSQSPGTLPGARASRGDGGPQKRHVSARHKRYRCVVATCTSLASTLPLASACCACLVVERQGQRQRRRSWAMAKAKATHATGDL